MSGGSLALAIWFGILTAIGPCTMATNVAAISLIVKDIATPRTVLRAGALYTIGNLIGYVLLAVVLISGLTQAPELSQTLQRVLGRLLGPLFIVSSVFLFEWVTIPLPTGRISQLAERVAHRTSWWTPFLLGFLFAVAFCPISAALFFLSLIPLAISHRDPFLLPAAYGLGTSLPVLIAALACAATGKAFSHSFTKTRLLEKRARNLTGAVLLLCGLFLTLKEIYGLF